MNNPMTGADARELCFLRMKEDGISAALARRELVIKLGYMCHRDADQLRADDWTRMDRIVAAVKDLTTKGQQ